MSRRPFFRCRFIAVVTYLLAVMALVTAASSRVDAAAGSSPSLDALYAQILTHPGNIELNLRFADLAEHSGYLRWALSAYERVVLLDPNNSEGLAGLTRVRRQLQPNTTLLTVQLGSQYESAPHYYLKPLRPEWEAVGSAALLDERTINGVRWRTDGVLGGVVHTRNSELSYGVVGADTGPVLDAFPGWAFHPAIGGSASYFDHRFYYGEGAVSGTLDSLAGGIYRAFTVRGAYRSYATFFPSNEGPYVEARAKVAVPNAFGSGAVVMLSPWVLWSNISGNANVVVPTITELQPGAYTEVGGRIDILKSLTNWLVLGLNFQAMSRNYRTDLVLITNERRHDIITSPGISFTFPNLFAYQTDLRFDYHYIYDHSNDPTKRFNDHVAMASVVARFDPTTAPAWASKP